jgi:hypothetical protein
MATLAWPCSYFRGKHAHGKRGTWHPRRYTELETALGQPWPIARTLLLPITVVPATMVPNATINDTFPAWYFVMLLVIMAAWLIASLLILCFAGYRLAWRPRPEPPSEENNAAA